MNGIGPSPQANALETQRENMQQLHRPRTYMMNTMIARLHMTTNPLFNPKPISPWPATAVNTEAVRSFFLPTRCQVVERASARRQEEGSIGIDLNQKNRGESHDDIHNSDEDRDIGTQLWNHIGKDIVAVV